MTWECKDPEVSLELPAFSGRLTARHRVWERMLVWKIDREADRFCSSDIGMMVGLFTLLLGKDEFRVHGRRHNRSHTESRNLFLVDESHS